MWLLREDLSKLSRREMVSKPDRLPFLSSGPHDELIVLVIVVILSFLM